MEDFGQGVQKTIQGTVERYPLLHSIVGGKVVMEDGQ